MIKPVVLWRLLIIYKVMLQHTLNRDVLGKRTPLLRKLSYLNPWSFNRSHRNRGESLRAALETLGPIFVKFGQLLSTRYDLLPDDVIEALSQLQDKVPPFSGKQAQQMIETRYSKSIDQLFQLFEQTPLASASIAQVHAVKLIEGDEAVIKILRPNIKKTIHQDIELLYLAARLAERFWAHGKRLRLCALVSEFEQTIHQELDLMREAANASQLRRNFANSKMMYVPKIYWPYARTDMIVLERIYGVSISEVEVLRAHDVNLKKLAEHGVEIFFTQVFRDSFFHADMHPGNLFVDYRDPENPQYLGVDFGIMGSLSPTDQHYLAHNLLAFFNRDYRRVAVLHIESGWVPADTRVDQFEAAIRTVCEPIFERPLSEISFAQLLLRLFQTAEQFQMEVQPQLMLLQKTLLSVESLGRRLYPELDLWQTAKPFMTRWLKQQHSAKDFVRQALKEWSNHAEQALQLPRLAFNVLSSIERGQRDFTYRQQSAVAATSNSRAGCWVFLGAGLGLAMVFAASGLMVSSFSAVWQWVAGSTSAVCFVISALLRR